MAEACGGSAAARGGGAGGGAHAASSPASRPRCWELTTASPAAATTMFSPLAGCSRRASSSRTSTAAVAEQIRQALEAAGKDVFLDGGDGARGLVQDDEGRDLPTRRAAVARGDARREGVRLGDAVRRCPDVWWMCERARRRYAGRRPSHRPHDGVDRPRPPRRRRCQARLVESRRSGRSAARRHRAPNTSSGGADPRLRRRGAICARDGGARSREQAVRRCRRGRPDRPCAPGRCRAASHAPTPRGRASARRRSRGGAAAQGCGGLAPTGSGAR